MDFVIHYTQNTCTVCQSPVWTFMWMFRISHWRNAMLHIWHLYGLSPVWTLMCLFRFLYGRNALRRLYGLCSMWTLMWLLNVPDWLNTLSHMWHLYGLSPLWILLCLTSAPDMVNLLLQTVHSNGFSPEWLRLCTASKLPLSQHLPHSVHWCLLLWIFIWAHRPLWYENRFPQWLQEYNCSGLCLLLCVVKVSCDVNTTLGVHEYCFAEWCPLLWTFRLSSSKELPV